MAALATANRVRSARLGAGARAAPVPRPALRLAHARSGPVVRAQDSDASADVDKIVKDLSDKWDKVENKTSVVLYGAGAVLLVWFSSTLVTALNSIPLLPKLMELVGLGYTSWFIYRYLLFKTSREELVKDVEELKKKITGDAEPAAAAAPAAVPATPAKAASAVRSSTIAAADE